MTPFNEIRRFKQMRKSTRLNDMMIFLSDKSFFNLKDIMQEYGISKSTAIRDIQSLEPKIPSKLYTYLGGQPI